MTGKRPSDIILTGAEDLNKGVRKGWGWAKTTPLSLIFYKIVIACAKEIECFHILLLVNFST